MMHDDDARSDEVLVMNSDLLRKQRVQLAINPRVAASVIGVSLANYWDMESYPDEALVLTVAEAIRTCLVMQISPGDLFPAEGTPSTVLAGTDAASKPSLASIIADFEQKRAEIREADEWEDESISAAIQSEWHAVEMPLAMLRDICFFTEHTVTSVLEACLREIADIR